MDDWRNNAALNKPIIWMLPFWQTKIIEIYIEDNDPIVSGNDIAQKRYADIK